MLGFPPSKNPRTPHPGILIPILCLKEGGSRFSLPAGAIEAEAVNVTCLMLRASWGQTQEQSLASLSHDLELGRDSGGKGFNVRQMKGPVREGRAPVGRT